MMESAHIQLAQPLPALCLEGNTTTYPSLDDEILSIRFMYAWPDFREQVRHILNTLTLNGSISVTNSSEGEMYCVGNELGLTARFIQNVGVAVSKAYRHGTTGPASFKNFRFVDFHTVGTGPRNLCPDVVIVEDIINVVGANSGCNLRAVGEIKTPWTLPLEEITMASPDEDRLELQHPMGRLSRYMRRHNLRYGFLTTYAATIFVKRVENFRYELSPPILWNSANPSVRQCFLVLGTLLAENFSFVESSVLPSIWVPGPLASTRTSAYRPYGRAGEEQPRESSSQNVPHNGQAAHDNAQSNDPSQALSSAWVVTLPVISRKTVFLGSTDNESGDFCVVELVEIITGMPSEKCVFEAIYEGKPAILKSWPLDQENRYTSEVNAYIHGPRKP